MDKDQYFILKKSDTDYLGPNGIPVSTPEEAATFFYNKTTDTVTIQENDFGVFQPQRVCNNNGKNCSGNGRCLNTVCKCDSGWTGTACEKALYPKVCSGHGKSNNGICTCNDGWSGKDCSISIGTTGDGLSIWAIVCIVAGGFILMGLVYYFLIHRQKKEGPTYITPEHVHPPFTPDTSTSFVEPDSGISPDKLSPGIVKLSPPVKSSELTTSFSGDIDSPPSSDLISD